MDDLQFHDMDLSGAREFINDSVATLGIQRCEDCGKPLTAHDVLPYSKEAQLGKYEFPRICTPCVESTY